MNDPDAPGKRNFIDFAELEYRFPLTPEDRMKITPENLEDLTQEQVDQIYARLPAGPVPDGIFHGGVFFPQGEEGYSRVGEVVGGIMGRGVTAISDRIERIATYVWKGKVFDRDNMVLRNLIEDRTTLEALIDDDEDIETIEIERKGFLSAFAPTRTVWLLFPAKLHCGQSLLDSRRESIIIDYAYNDDLEDIFREEPDHWVEPQGPAHSRRDPHGAARLLSRPRLHQPCLHPELHAAQRGGRRGAGGDVPGRRRCRCGLLAGCRADLGHGRLAHVPRALRASG